MPGWVNSNRRSELPADWAATRQRILARDSFRCTWIQDNKRCKERATDVDHKKRGNDHSDANLRALCPGHHKRKSGQEGAEALAEKRQENSKKFRREEAHPGLLP